LQNCRDFESREDCDDTTPIPESSSQHSETDGPSRISSQINTLSLQGVISSHSSEAQDIRNSDGSPRPYVLVLTTFSSPSIRAAILDAYQKYENKYMHEHKGRKPPFNIREDRTHKEHVAVKKKKL